MRKLLLSMAAFAAISAHAQLTESFADGNFSANPAWGGNTTDWIIAANSDVAAGATGSNTLRLQVPSGGGTHYLSTQVMGTWGAQQTWGFWMGRRGAAATTQNTSYVWLWSSESDVTTATVDGYRIRFGDDAGGDNVFLEVVTDGVATTVVSSPSTAAGTVPNGLQDIGFLVRVTRDAAGLWSLFTSTLPQTTANGAVATEVPNATNANVAQGTATNTAYTTFDNGYLAFAALHSTGGPAREGAEFDQLQFSFVAGSILPVKFTSFDAKANNSSVNLLWNVALEENLSSYEVEKSGDGRRYERIGSVAAVGRSSYSFVDNKLSSAVTYYRIKAVDVDGKLTYSAIVTLKGGKASIEIKAFPMPAVNDITIQHASAVAGSEISISSAEGRVVKSVIPANGSQQTGINIATLRPGVYFVNYNDGNGGTGSIKIVKQ